MKKVIKNPFERFTQKGAASALWMCLLLAGGFPYCTTIGDNTSQGVYYVVGYDGNVHVDEEKGTAKSGGYLFISENLQDSLLTSDRILIDNGECFGVLLDGIIDFPVQSMSSGSTGCGYAFFSEEYRFAFKVHINSYRPMIEEEQKNLVRRFTCPGPWWSAERDFNPVIITSISKIQ